MAPRRVRASSKTPHNAGFGAAINQGIRASTSPYVATLNDDAVAHPGWLDALVAALEARPDAGMCASQVRLFGEPRLDSAGMLVARDGSSKQRGHGRPPEDFPVAEEVLMPSGSAALYRRAMLDEIGGFDDDFFLYCEDTDLGLRARWAGWKCLYVPARRGGASLLAFGRPRLARQGILRGAQPPLRAGQELPRPRMLLAAPFVSVARYSGTPGTCCKGQGSAARFRAEGNAGPKMLWYVHARPRRALRQPAAPAGASAAQIRSPRAHHARGIPPPAAQPRHQRPKDGRALMRPEATRFPAGHRAGLQ